MFFPESSVVVFLLCFKFVSSHSLFLLCSHCIHVLCAARWAYSMNEWMNERNERMNEWMNEWTNEWMNGKMGRIVILKKILSSVAKKAAIDLLHHQARLLSYFVHCRQVLNLPCSCVRRSSIISSITAAVSFFISMTTISFDWSFIAQKMPAVNTWNYIVSMLVIRCVECSMALDRY